jgi:uncharacterized protein
MKRPSRWLYLVLIALMVIGVTRLRFDVQVLNILPPDLGVVRGLKLYQEHFANARELIITVAAADAEQAASAAQAIAERLRKENDLVSSVTWRPPWTEHPDQAAELIGYLWLNQAPSIFSDLTNRFAPEVVAATLSEGRDQLSTSLSPQHIARLSYDPFGLSQLPASISTTAPTVGEGESLFSSADGTFRMLIVQARPELRDYRACLEWLKRVKAIVRASCAEQGISPSLKIGYTGAPAFVAEISSGMEGDLRISVTTALIIVIILFLWTHRRVAPLLWLLTLLALTLGGTLAIGGLIFGTLSVISVGFAAILLGLAADYGLVLYQESLHAEGVSARELRRKLSPSIVWSAATTSGAFLILNFGGLPGLGQLGSLVAIGITLAAILMLCFFLPPLMKNAVPSRPLPPTAGRSEAIAPIDHPEAVQLKVAWATTALIFVSAVLILVWVRPKLDRTADSLRPLNSSAYDALEQVKSQLSGMAEPEWLIVSGGDESELARKLDLVEPILQKGITNGELSSFNLATGLIPRAKYQYENLAMARSLLARQEALREAAREHGFTSNSLAFTEGVFSTWQRATLTAPPFWPTNRVSQWVLDKLVARGDQKLHALGLVYAATNRSHELVSEAWVSDLGRAGIYLSSWPRLGSALLGVVKGAIWRVAIPMVLLLLVCLWLAFRRVGEVLISLGALLFSCLCLWAWMAVAGWSWNLLNLMALPLLLGVGVDYSIHMQLGLRRHQGEVRATRRTVGRAVFLCAATTVAGFGSNAWSSNGGLVSLGKVCAAGVAFTYLTSTWLLPAWWRTFFGQTAKIESGVSTPSSLYRPELWRIGLWLARVLPDWICVRITRMVMEAYWLLVPRRREVVVQNLLPATNGDGAVARQTAKNLFHQFGRKLLDLWRYEAGLPINHLLEESHGWEHFVNAQAQGRGVLFLTPHLGNWEFGGPWLTRRGFDLQVITLAEPGEDFTELRQASRARWNIDTLVVGEDPFAFVEIIRRLENGATVALLVDRPPAPSSIDVTLFGRPFAASIAAAELARATGCVLLPVYLPRNEQGYSAHILPPIQYERAALRDRAARQKLTQEIMRAFEPVIRQHLDQWYHFVPIWSKS